MCSSKREIYTVIPNNAIPKNFKTEAGTGKNVHKHWNSIIQIIQKVRVQHTSSVVN